MFTLTINDEFLTFTNAALNRHLNLLNISELEKTGIRTSVYHIFKKHSQIEKIYFELLDYLETENGLTPLIPQIKFNYKNYRQALS